MNALVLHDPPWFDVMLNQVECCQCHRRVSPATAKLQGWRQIFTKHPSKQEHPELFCGLCKLDWI